MIYNTIFPKDLDRKVYDYIDPWGVILASVEWYIRAYYHRTVGFTPSQVVFGIYMLYNLMSIVDWSVVTASKQWRFEIDNVSKNFRQVRHDYNIGNLVYVEKTGNCIIGNKDRIKSLKSSQMVPFEFRGEI